MCLLERQRTEEGREHESVGWGNRNIGRGKDSMDGSGGEKRKVKQADVSHSFQTAVNVYWKLPHNEEKIQ